MASRGGGRTGSCNWQRRAGQGTALAVLAATLVAVPVLALQSGPQADTLPQPPGQHYTYRICPVADCRAYLNPAKVKGIALSSLENWLLFTRSAESQIRAVYAEHAKSWDGNAVRVQLLQDKLVGPGGNLWSPGYFSAIRRIISYALARKMYVIINAQTEPATGFPLDETLPTRATDSFWAHFTTAYGHNPHVIFDLFNEPRCLPGQECTWSDWQKAMWPLVRYVRARGSLNQLWLEGKRYASELAGVPLIHCAHAVAWCQGLVYSFHKPGCPWPWDCAPSPAVWWRQFGYLAQGGVPVVDGEMANYRGGYYWDHSTQRMTQYLWWLRHWGIGVVAWSLQPGIMTATANLTSAVGEPQSAGRIFWRYFHGVLFHPAVTAWTAGEGTGRLRPGHRSSLSLAAP